MSDLEARIAEVIAAHGRDGRKTWGSFVVCTCEPAWTGHSLEHPAHVAAMLAPVIAEAQAEAKRELLAELMSDEASERARKLVENELVEWRDNCMSMLGRRNGLVIRSKDGTPSSIVRFGFETGWKMCLKDHADKLATP